MNIPNEAVEAAAKAIARATIERESKLSRQFFPRTDFKGDALLALEAAAPHMLANLTAESPRLPTAVRNQLFEMLGDFMDKFELESRVKGPSRHVAAPGYEWGDMCGDFERRVVAALRSTP